MSIVLVLVVLFGSNPAADPILVGMIDSLHRMTARLTATHIPVIGRVAGIEPQ